MGIFEIPLYYHTLIYDINGLNWFAELFKKGTSNFDLKSIYNRLLCVSNHNIIELS